MSKILRHKILFLIVYGFFNTAWASTHNPNTSLSVVGGSDQVPIAVPDSRSSKKAWATKAVSYATCNYNNFGSESGSTLVNHLKSVDPVCTYDLFTPSTVSRNALSHANMTTVLNAARSVAVSYNGTNTVGMEQLILFIRAGYFQASGGSIPAYTSSHQSLVRALISDFSRNSYFYSNTTDEHAQSVQEFMVMIQNVKEMALGLPIAKTLIDNYNQTRSASYEQTAAVNSALGVLTFGSTDAAYIAAINANTGVIDSIYSFIRDKKWVLSTNRSWLYDNMGIEFGRFLSITGAAKNRAKYLIKLVLPQVPQHSPVWLNIAEKIMFYTPIECAEYTNVCNYKATAINMILPTTHTCSSTLKMRVQQMTSAQLAEICSLLGTHESYFHSKLNTGNSPVAGDLNKDLLMIIFNSDADYKKYGGPLYGIPTNNGGYYLEGDPSKADNQATFYAEEADWLLPQFKVWNLEHEYTHYLDGRFNLAGGFSAPGNANLKTVWWTEGLADYIALKNVNQKAIDTAKDGSTHSFSEVLDNTYSSGLDRIYSWGYLAVRFMFEKHPAEVTKFLNAARAGNWSAIQTLYNSWNYNNEFATWLQTLSGGGTNNVAPTARVNGPFSAAVNAAISFSSNGSSDSDGSIASYAWNFGDGSSSTSANPSHSYTTAGTYTVTLTVTDNGGATGSASTTATITGGGSSTVTNACASQSPYTGNALQDNVSICVPNGSSSNTIRYFYINVPSGATRLVIQSAYGSGNGDVYYNASTWATSSANTQRSTNAGNTESIIVNNPSSGYRYISVIGNPSGMSLVVDIQ